MLVLVAYGSTGGGTAEIAQWIAGELRRAGLDVRLVSAGEVDEVGEYDAVVLGAALYASGWHGDARRFVHRFAGQFTGRPVWLFSSGPLDRSSETGQLPPVPHTAAALRDLPARRHVTFGGRMTPQAHGWIGYLGRRSAGDFRDPNRVRAWARELAAEILAGGGASRAGPMTGRSTLTGPAGPRSDGRERTSAKEEEMSALLPRLLGDMTDWFEVDFPRPLPAIRFEDTLSEDEYILRAELPGLDPEKDIEITALHGVLTVKAERREEEQSRHRSEFRYGSLQRAVRLPVNADEEAIAARYSKGILEITVPLSAPQPAGRQITVTREE
ncbi:Hsp20 family protein [Paractinoplanes atraurantiacus]|uniref:Molecular chaperone IbpA, HSP20 family n=1 Tax=Paractinoplanes atraurantiacus TaxID=1036182 RepID=A0A285JGF0_9ACTN|nr:Hsp20 family protein [Actinoplanes atraurantiacus]SNY59153.1 Molecular chaperone IbpA, HSP20 family [Actinoplanes atraurantiacus]